MKDRLPVAQLIYEALDRTGYDALLLAEFLGERKLANLHKLIEQARSFDRAGIFMLSDFITQLSQFVARQPDEPLAATHPESNKVVKLMSIHQSKGLEFPVVIVPDVGRPRRVIGPVGGVYPAARTDVQRRRRHDRLRPVDDGRKRRGPGGTHPAALRGHDAGGRLPDPLGRRGRAGQGHRALAGADRQTLRSDDRQRAVRPRHIGRARARVTVTTTEPAIQSKPVDLRQRRDLLKIVEKARQMAADGQGRQSKYLGPVAPDAGARRQYSFSRLTGKLHARPVGGDFSPLDAEVSAAPPLDARGLGTLVHAVLAEVDFARPDDVADLVRRHAEEQLSEMAGRQR